MKREEFKNLVHEAVDEVMKEIITAPVQKDPALMTPDEKKREMMKARQSAGTTDQNVAVDLVKREGKLREMARTAIQYKLKDGWEDKLAQLKQSYSEKKGKWFDVLVQGIAKSEEGKATIKSVADALNLPQQRLNQFGIEAYNAGIIEPAGRTGGQANDGTDAEDGRIIPFHAKTNPDSDDYEEPSQPLSSLYGDDAKGDNADLLFVGSGPTDDFSDDSTDTLPYDVTDYGNTEPEEEDGVEKSSPRQGGLSIEDSYILDKYDDLIRSIASLRGTLRNSGRRFGSEPVREEFAKDSSKSVSYQQEILSRKRQELANLLRQHGGLIQKYRDLGKLKALIKQDDEELPSEFSDIELDEETKNRLQELAKIKK